MAIAKKRWLIPGALAVLLALGAGCSPSSDEKAKEAAVVRKKIAVETPAPAPAGAPQAVRETPPPAETPPQAVTAPAPQAPATPPQAAPVPSPQAVPAPADGKPAVPAVSEPSPKAEVATAASDKPEAAVAPETPEAAFVAAFEKKEAEADDKFLIVGRLDPFVPLFKDETETDKEATEEGPGSDRVPLTPLEKVDLGQIKLTAIVRTQSLNKALVEEKDGKGYVVQIGTFMGRNGGRVTEILNDRVIVEEETTNALGKKKVRQTQLRLVPGEEDAANE